MPYRSRCYKEIAMTEKITGINENSNRMEFFRNINYRGLSSLILFFSGKEACPANSHFGPAIRAQYLLHFIIRGKGRFSVNNHTYSLRENQVFLIQPNITTYYSADSENPWEYIWIGFDGRDVQTILQSCGLLGAHPYIDYIPGPEIMYYLNRIVDGMKDQSVNDYELLGTLLLIFGYLSRNRKPEPFPGEKDYLKKAVSFIRNNYYKNITVQNIADYVNINRSYLYRLFIQEFSVSPQKYIFNFRFHMATDMLTNTDMTVSAIALNCGFKDASTFCSQFRRCTGFTPKQYRNIDGDKQFTWKSSNFFNTEAAQKNGE